MNDSNHDHNDNCDCCSPKEKPTILRKKEILDRDSRRKARNKRKAKRKAMDKK